MSKYFVGDKFRSQHSEATVTEVQEDIDTWLDGLDTYYVVQWTNLAYATYDEGTIDGWLASGYAYFPFSSPNTSIKYSHSQDPAYNSQLKDQDYKPNIPNTCTCEMRDLMMYGCKCGYLDKERRT